MRNGSFTPLVAACVLVMCGCNDLTDTGTSVGTTGATPDGTPAATPTYPTQFAPGGTPNWTADATVVSVTSTGGHACGWGTTPGAQRSGVDWEVTVTGDTVALDEDTRNWPTDDIPYTGHLDGAQFVTSYKSASDYAKYICQFREATLSGQFTTDSTFVAGETLIWGTPGSQTTVVRHWTGSKL